jgi:XTP/dITP diphosphohydrolase
MTQLIFATNNKYKVQEIQSAIGKDLDIISMEEAGINIDIPEPHDTLESNASAKSWTIYRMTGLNCFSEDTGLEIHALHGEPGVRSARYAGDDKSFDRNIEKVLTSLKNISDRSARFRTVISLIWNGNEYMFEGICEGTITKEKRGSLGFGYDPIFMPRGSTCTFGEMSAEGKNQYSHRTKAGEKLVLFLQECLRSGKKS